MLVVHDVYNYVTGVFLVLCIEKRVDYAKMQPTINFIHLFVSYSNKTQLIASHKGEKYSLWLAPDLQVLSNGQVRVLES